MQLSLFLTHWGAPPPQLPCELYSNHSAYAAELPPTNTVLRRSPLPVNMTRHHPWLPVSLEPIWSNNLPEERYGSRHATLGSGLSDAPPIKKAGSQGRHLRNSSSLSHDVRGLSTQLRNVIFIASERVVSPQMRIVREHGCQVIIQKFGNGQEISWVFTQPVCRNEVPNCMCAEAW